MISTSIPTAINQVQLKLTGDNDNKNSVRNVHPDSFTFENVCVLIGHGDDGVDGRVSAQHAAGLAGFALVRAASADGGWAKGCRGWLRCLLAIQSLELGVAMRGNHEQCSWREIGDSAGGGT